MLINRSNLIYHNLVGLRAKVIASKDPTQVGMEGKVADETSRTLTISAEGLSRMVPKVNSTFAFYIPEEAIVMGSDIAFSPEDRLKRLQRSRR